MPVELRGLGGGYCDGKGPFHGITEYRIPYKVPPGGPFRRSGLIQSVCVFTGSSLGTLEEIFEAWTWTQLGIHRHPLGGLNVAG